MPSRKSKNPPNTQNPIIVRRASQAQWVPGAKTRVTSASGRPIAEKNVAAITTKMTRPTLAKDVGLGPARSRYEFMASESTGIAQVARRQTRAPIAMTGADAGTMDSKTRLSAVTSNATAKIRFHTISVVIFVALWGNYRAARKFDRCKPYDANLTAGSRRLA